LGCPNPIRGSFQHRAHREHRGEPEFSNRRERIDRIELSFQAAWNLLSWQGLKTAYNLSILFNMNHNFSAVIKRDGPWWIGWIVEVPGVNSQGKTRKELLENLASALHEALEINRANALAEAGNSYEEMAIPG
jgi:predicted RNase H-like HicB family nuclease